MITQERLKELLIYDPETGLFYRRLKSGRIKPINNKPNNYGYIQIRVGNGYRELAHRLAFLYMEGYIPEFVDHINRIRDDNRWSNLRDSSRQENNRNRAATSNSGYLGVSWDIHLQKWRVYTNNDEGARVYGGLFNHEDLESAVYKANGLRLELHGTLAVIEEFTGFPKEMERRT
ncbi:hypothetical protein [Escherichia phage SUT_E1620]|nr:hypothetical protein [Escherichia phage SUT_E1620]